MNNKPTPCLAWKVFWSSNCYRGWDKWMYEELRRGLRPGYEYVDRYRIAWEWWNFYEGFDERYYYGYFPPIHSMKPKRFVDGGVFFIVSRNPFIGFYGGSNWCLVGVYGGVEVLSRRQYYGGMVWESIPEEHKRLLDPGARREILDNGYYYVKALKEYSTPIPAACMSIDLWRDLKARSLRSAGFTYIEDVEQGISLLDKTISFMEERSYGYEYRRECLISPKEVIRRLRNARSILEGYLRGEIPSIITGYVESSTRNNKIINNNKFKPPHLTPSFRRLGLPEKVVEDALVENLSVVEEELKPIDRQYTIPGGRVDILAKDRHGRLVVVEVKSGLADDSTLTQLLSYMSVIEEKEGKPVRGIIVAEDFTRRLVLAARRIENVKLVKIKPRIIIEKTWEQG